MRALVIGLSEGIRRALVERLPAEPDTGTVGLSRSLEGLDITDESLVERHARAMKEAHDDFDLIINAT